MLSFALVFDRGLVPSLGAALFTEVVYRAVTAWYLFSFFGISIADKYETTGAAERRGLVSACCSSCI